MTIIEFYDKADINNIVGALVYKPHKVILIGDCNRDMNQSVEDYRRLLSKKGINTVIDPVKVETQNLHRIYDALVKIVEENEDCVFDLAGGDDLFLVAVGMIAQQYKDKVQLHRIDARKNTVTDCDAGLNTTEEIPLSLSVEELVSVYGGRVIYTEDLDDGTYKWDFNEGFIRDIEKMWDIFKDDPRGWNTQMNALDGMSGKYYGDEDLYIEANKEEAKAYLKTKDVKFVFFNRMFRRLASAGIIRGYNPGFDSGVFSFSFKNEQVKRCLTKAGQLLELYATYVARELFRDGEAFFDDVATGVYIDWDGKLSSEDEADVHNEIDIILMKGLVPVFISCKSGVVKVDELYKLSSVADRFGGPYVKKVLLSASLDDDKRNGPVVRARAKQMGIRIIDDVDNMSVSYFRKQLCMLWDN
ncbi:MAG: DUF1887 family protein [Ruminococcus sp.]|nr:DUF1887 family protein [Ruminococcus sp.]